MKQRLLILVCSPKRRGGASGFFARLLRLFLPGKGVVCLPLRSRADFPAALDALKEAGALCLSLPLYTDSLPSHLLEFLLEAQTAVRARQQPLQAAAVLNNGFVEGSQNRPALCQLRAWCARANAVWLGGAGIGGGTMLHVLSIVFPILMAVSLAFAALALAGGEAPSLGMFAPLLWQAGAWLFLNAGALVCLALLSRSLRRGRAAPDRFTRVLLPSFLFLPIADLFMFLSSLFQGRLLFTLLKKDQWNGKK